MARENDFERTVILALERRPLEHAPHRLPVGNQPLISEIVRFHSCSGRGCSIHLVFHTIVSHNQEGQDLSTPIFKRRMQRRKDLVTCNQARVQSVEKLEGGNTSSKRASEIYLQG